MADERDARIAELERDLTASKKTVNALAKRVEKLEGRGGSIDRYAVLNAMAHLESLIDQRTHELEASQQRYRALYDHAPAGVLTIDPKGVLTEANQTFSNHVSTDRDALVGRELSSFFAISSAERLRGLVASGLGRVGDLELRSLGGRTLLTTIAPLPGFDAFQVVLHDVTERRELEAELQHTRRLAAIGHLAAGVAHEINNPLAVIQGRVELVDILGVEVPPLLRKHLDIIGRHAIRIARIVSSLQAFARPRAAEPEAVPVHELVTAATEVAGASLRGVQLELDVPHELCIRADRWQLERVLVNLFNNAADAMSDGGRIWVTAVADDDRVRIDVADEGEGIPAELLDQVFTPFVSGRSRARRSGLGLAITWGILQEHDGTIRAENRPNGGAVFRMDLPRCNPDDTPVVARRADAPALSRVPLTVLCVEDEAAIVQLVQGIAERAGHRVLTASSAEDGLALVDHNHFDVVLSDVRLPGMSGVQLREHLRADHPHLARRLILMSGYLQAFSDDVLYLQKPFRARELLDTLDQASRA